MTDRLYYVHDPMCSWCWAFQECWQKVREALGNEVEIIRLLGGLAPDSDETMPEQMQSRIQATWRRIESTVAGVRFNFDFWQRCRPRRSTHASCRAVIAARRQGQAFDVAMTTAIQRAYYREARNPSEAGVLLELAQEIGLDRGRFGNDLNSPETHSELEQEMALAAKLGVDSFPALVLESNGSLWPIGIDYNNADYIVETINALRGD